MSKTTKKDSKSFDRVTKLQGVAEKLSEAIDSIELHGSGEHEAGVNELARLSVAFNATCGELRQEDKSSKRALSSYSTEDVMAHLKASLSSSELDKFARELTGADDEEPLL